MHWRTLSAIAIFCMLAATFVIVSRHDHSMPSLRLPTLWAMFLLAVLCQFITHTMGLGDINNAFDLMHKGESIRSVVHMDK